MENNSGFLVSLLGGFLASALMTVAGVSVLMGQFPPDIARFKKSVTVMREIVLEKEKSVSGPVGAVDPGTPLVPRTMDEVQSRFRQLQQDIFHIQARVSQIEMIVKPKDPAPQTTPAPASP